MNMIIVTNNPLVKDYYSNIRYLEGTIHDVLIEVRNLVHKGHRIISHPLPGSIKILLSPYRSVVLSHRIGEIDIEQLMIIEESLSTFMLHKNERELDKNHHKDYMNLDFELLKSAL